LPTLNIIVGYPGDSDERLIETLQRAYSLRPNSVVVSRLASAPGGSGDGCKTNSGVASTSASDIDRLMKIGNASTRSYCYWLDAAKHGRELSQLDGKARSPSRVEA
jgi:hypothetical protein